MLIDSESLWLAATNTYVVAAEPGGLCVVVDAPPDPAAVVALVGKHSLTPTALLVTHGHVDHAGGIAGVVARTGVTAYAHPDDDWLTMDPMAQVRALFGDVGGDFAPPETHADLADGQSLSLAGLSVEVLHTPGHTPGHCCFRVGGVLFSGDQLFAGSIGRTDLPGGDFDTLMESMRSKILTLPDDTEVLPGHGPRTTLARERRSNPFLQDLIA
jgi:glyoxylase-like metal-dependent hydrolase (beta-lactamase superfamily II)